MQIAKNKVVTMDYTLMVDGEIIDTSIGKKPFTLIHGIGMVIPGFTAAIDGLQAGDKKSFNVSAGEGYGEYNDEMVETYPKDDFPEDMEIVPGAQLVLQTDENQEIPCVVRDVSDNEVTIDFNHPLAGKSLDFDIEIHAVRDATADELSHGHVHGPDGHHHH